MNEELYRYIDEEIIPRYDAFDRAHRRDHVHTVMEHSLQLAAFYPVDRDMVLAIAAFHDTGLVDGREIHHLSSGRIVREDRMLPRWFSPDEIELMAEAVEDHRASSSRPPRSIYGKIVAEADRVIDAETIVQRTILYGWSHYPALSKREHYERFCRHMEEKYSDRGYLKLWIPESVNAVRLEEFRRLLRDEDERRMIFEREWKFLSDEKG